MTKMRSDIGLQFSRTIQSRPPVTSILTFVAVTAVGIVLCICAYLTLPSLASTYHIDRAQRRMEHGLRWPEPRRFDSLPSQQDATALDAASSDLAAARFWQPNDAYSHRLMWAIYAARHDWLHAAEESERALVLAPHNPLIAWERAQAYEQMWFATKDTPRDHILPELGAAPIEAPAQSIDTVYCRNNQPQTCYVDLDRYTQPYAEFPSAAPVTADILFMHPPAAVSVQRTIPPGSAALQFLMGLDPNVRNWRTDGATFQIWITPVNATPIKVFEHTIDASIARTGWVPGAVDLSPWAGQFVQLQLKTTGGPSGDTVDDWYGWGDVVFTSPESAAYSVKLPQLRMDQAWAALPFDEHSFFWQIDSARAVKDYDAANDWLARAEQHGVQQGDLLYYRGLLLLDHAKFGEAQSLLENAVKQPSLTGKSDMFYQLGLIRQQQLNAQAAIEDYATAIHTDSFGSANTKADALFRFAVLHEGQGISPVVYIHELEQAVQLSPRHAGAHASLGTAYYLRDHDVSRAIGELNTALAIDGTNKWTYLRLAQLYTLEGDQPACTKLEVDIASRFHQDQEIQSALAANKWCSYRTTN